MDITKFLSDFVKRLFAESPVFFKILRWISVIVALITGLPSFLEQLGIKLPEQWDAVSSKVVAIAALVGAFVAQLTVTESAKAEKGIQ